MITTATVATTVIASLGTVAAFCGLVSRHFRIRMGDAERLHRIVRNLVDASAGDGEDWIPAALRELASALRADEAWLLVEGAPPRAWTWSHDGSLAADQARIETDAIASRRPWKNGRILDTSRVRSGAERDGAGDRGSRRRVGTVLLRSALDGETAVMGARGRGLPRIRPEVAQAVAAVLAAILHRLSERRRSEQARDAAIGRRMETIGTFASGMAHNLNNIMAAIAGFNAITEMHAAPDSAVGRSATDIDVSVRRAQQIVSEVLSFGRRLERPSSLVDVAELLSETAAMLAVSLPGGITLAIDPPPQASAVAGDHAQLQQVLLNISNNAAHAMPRGGVIRWQVRHVVLAHPKPLDRPAPVPAPGAYLALSIRDEGGGMPPEVAARIFEPFFTTREGGSGLGLSTARDIVRRHGGTIEVDSAPGQGSDFTVWLPADRIAAPGVPSAPPGSGEGVLILNRDPVQLYADEEVVAALGYEPVGMREPSAAGLLPDHVRVALIVEDGRPAVEVAAEVARAAGRSIPLVFASAAAIAGGAGGRIRHPFLPLELAMALSAALAPDRLQDVPSRPPFILSSTSRQSGRATTRRWLPTALAASMAAIATQYVGPARWTHDRQTERHSPSGLNPADLRTPPRTDVRIAAFAAGAELPAAAKGHRTQAIARTPLNGGHAARPNQRLRRHPSNQAPLQAHEAHDRNPRLRFAAWVRRRAEPVASATVRCHVYSANDWRLIGSIGPAECVRYGFSKRKVAYVLSGADILARKADRILVWRKGAWRPAPEDFSSGARTTSLDATNHAVCRRFDGAGWRDVGALSTRACAERAFSRPGTGYVQSGADLLTRRADLIGVQHDGAWRAVARISQRADLDETVTLKKL